MKESGPRWGSSVQEMWTTKSQYEISTWDLISFLSNPRFITIISVTLIDRRGEKNVRAAYLSGMLTVSFWQTYTETEQDRAPHSSPVIPSSHLFLFRLLPVNPWHQQSAVHLTVFCLFLTYEKFQMLTFSLIKRIVGLIFKYSDWNSSESTADSMEYLLCSQPFSDLGVLKTSKTIWVSKCSALPKTSCTFSHGITTWKSYSLYSHQIKICFCVSSQKFSNPEEIISHFAVEDPWIFNVNCAPHQSWISNPI